MGGGVKVGVPPGLLPVKAGPKGLGWAWEGCLRVLAWHKTDSRWGAFPIFTTLAPLPPHTPTGPPPTQVGPESVHHGSNSCGELAKGWGPLIHPLTTQFGRLQC